jgi:DNA polymerase-1
MDTAANKNKILLIDGENILHQSFHKFEKLKSTDGKPSGAIFGFFKSLHMYITRFSPDDLYISFDNGHSKLRYELNPNYKGHRKNISVDYESLQQQKAMILKMLGMLRIKFIFDKKKLTNYEGDDFLAYIILKGLKDSKITLISSDKDFNQLLGKHPNGNSVKIFNPRKEELIRVDNCKSLFGYESNETVDYLSMVGDTSDDIKGIPGIGPVKARKILDEYGTLKNFLDHHNQTSNVEVIEKNKKLIDLNWYINNVLLDKLPIKKKKSTKYDKFREICVEYSLASFLTNKFMEPFKELLE